MRLITGSRGNLGKFLHKNVWSLGLHRQNWDEIKKYTYDTIVHCANDFSPDKSESQLYRDNITLTRKLCKLPHKLFVFISSIDVYPKADYQYLDIHSDQLDTNNISSTYGQSKLQCEYIVQQMCPSWIIIRPSSLMGYKQNSLTKVVQNKKISLSASSIMNCVLYEDVFLTIKYLTKKGIKNKIFNLVADKNVCIQEVVDKYEFSSHIGDYEYRCGNIYGEKLYKIIPELRRSSILNIERWISKYL